MTDKRIKHGFGRREGRPPEFLVWCKMRQRCVGQSGKDFENYGGRGISVCDRWQDFAAFFADMGPRPSPEHSIDRINNDGNYEPGNCRWATRTEQARNRRPRQIATHCARSHVLDEAGTYRRSDGKRGCRECRRLNMMAYYARKKRA